MQKKRKNKNWKLTSSRPTTRIVTVQNSFPSLLFSHFSDRLFRERDLCIWLKRDCHSSANTNTIVTLSFVVFHSIVKVMMSIRNKHCPLLRSNTHLNWQEAEYSVFFRLLKSKCKTCKTISHLFSFSTFLPLETGRQQTKQKRMPEFQSTLFWK